MAAAKPRQNPSLAIIIEACHAKSTTPYTCKQVGGLLALLY